MFSSTVWPDHMEFGPQVKIGNNLSNIEAPSNPYKIFCCFSIGYIQQMTDIVMASKKHKLWQKKTHHMTAAIPKIQKISPDCLSITNKITMMTKKETWGIGLTHLS